MSRPSFTIQPVGGIIRHAWRIEHSCRGERVARSPAHHLAPRREFNIARRNLAYVSFTRSCVLVIGVSAVKADQAGIESSSGSVNELQTRAPAAPGSAPQEWALSGQHRKWRRRSRSLNSAARSGSRHPMARFAAAARAPASSIAGMRNVQFMFRTCRRVPGRRAGLAANAARPLSIPARCASCAGSRRKA